MYYWLFDNWQFHWKVYYFDAKGSHVVLVTDCAVLAYQVTDKLNGGTHVS